MFMNNSSCYHVNIVKFQNLIIELMNTLLMSLMIMIMTHEMPKLPYAHNALEPVISQQTIDYHYGKHLQTYVNNLNNLVPGTEFENKDLVTIVATAPDGAIFNNAGQVLNHTLYFLQFSPKPICSGIARCTCSK